MSLTFKKIYALGLMSGTSMDAINVSLVKTDGIELEELNINQICPYSDKTIKLLNEILDNLPRSLSKFSLLNETSELITLDHFKSIKNILSKTNIVPEIIGFHGQTVFHNPKKSISIQLGNSKLLSKLSKIDVIGNFRNLDIKFGGEGAPIAPIYHQQIIKKFNLKLPCCFINIGGVSNITYWDGNVLLGFDCGPGNTLMDKFMQEKFQLSYDKFGRLAKQGTPISKILTKCFEDNFFKKKFPKSLDKSYFFYLLELIGSYDHTPEDIMATLSSITAHSIKKGLKILPVEPQSIYIMGGGAYNTTLVKSLKEMYAEKINLIDEIGLDASMIEANLIAYLAVRKIRNLPSTFPETTGVNKPTCLGNLFKYKN